MHVTLLLRFFYTSNKAEGSVMNTNSNAILYRNCFRLSLLFLLTAFISSVTAQGVATVPLNDEERAFLAANPIVRVHNESKFPPFNFTENNQPMGYSIDYMNLLAKKLGVEVDYISGPSWNEFIDMIKIGDIDVMLNITATPERREYILFTPSYLRLPNVLASRSDDAFDNMSQLIGKTVAYVEGFWHGDVIHRDFPEVKGLAVADSLASLEAVVNGKADAVLGRSAIFKYLMIENSITGVSVSGEIDLGLSEDMVEQRIGVRMDGQLLRSALIKAMRLVTYEEEEQITSRWFGSTNLESGFSLTEEERIWLNTHKTLRLGLDSAWRPIEYLNESGEHSGMSSDFMKVLADRLDLEMVPVMGLEWAEVLDNMKEKKLDIMSAVNSSPVREQYMNFTSPYLSFPHVIINLNDSIYIQEIEDLYGKRVVVERGFISQQYLTQDHPQIHLVLAENTLEALKMTSLGEVDAYVGSLPSASYLISEYGISNLKVAAPTQYTSELSIGVRKDWPQLIGILQKALDSIGIEEKNQIRQRWMAVRYAERIDYTLLWQVLVGAAVLLILTMIWATQIKRRNKELQERTRELQISNVRAKAAAVSKADFLAAMSHEIRTPMNGVIGMVDLLRQTKLDDDQKQMLQTVNDSGQSLLTIINDILDFSKIEAGKLDLESIPVSLTDVVEGSAQTIAVNATKKGLRLITYVDPELPQFVTGDPVRIRQIIINLGGNAIKFTEEGTVVIRAERVGDNNDDNKITIRFSVIDQGIGISEEGQDKLFQAFSQADSSTTRQFGGTGLGLTISKRLTELMDGEIGVKSQLGEGSEFYVILPFDHSVKQVPEDKVRNLEGLRILLTSSDPTEEAILRRYLEYWHAEITSCNELGTCLDQCLTAKAEDKPYDIVIICPQWTREEQFEMREKVTSHSRLSDIRFICLLAGKRRSSRLDLPDSVCLDVNPLRRAAFLSAVAVAVGRASPEVYYEEEVEDLKATLKAPTVNEVLAQGTLILVAEDNPTNRDVIGRQLTLLGYDCEMAEDGELALEAWRNKHYGVLLTDCHMPNMDGFELTDAIRNDEKDTKTRAPIIAITANALQGEAERCLAAGMDDYLSKPIDMKDLRQALRKWMPQMTTETTQKEGAEKDTSTVEKTIAANEETGEPIDEQALKSMFGDDPEMFKEILNDFVPPSHQIIKDIQNGWKARSAEAVKQAAHKLKSSARSIGAMELADICQSLETAGKEEDWEMINNNVPKLDQLMKEIEGFINAL
jgi:signal transduction histidine kinase/CheY-like chemotaxis protein/HPt (histidine-containing phosphotransfer) domain-containing protein